MGFVEFSGVSRVGFVNLEFGFVGIFCGLWVFFVYVNLELFRQAFFKGQGHRSCGGAISWCR